MKYIRTKDGIYKYADYLGIHNGKRYGLMDDKQGNRITMCQEPEELYKVADTIEELCDCYSYGTETTIDYLVAKSWKKADKSRHIYGCILTDKGIIRVAEINDTGELELL